jgi:membrane-bound lytic murein transglycosylase D
MQLHIRKLTGWMNLIICVLLLLSIKAASQSQEAKQADSSSLNKELIIATSNSSASSDLQMQGLLSDASDKDGFKNLYAKSTMQQAALAQLHPKAISFVKDYLEENGNRLDKMKTWGDPYFRMIEKILTKYNIPKEMKYLAVIESDLKSNATSWAGAVGPWQLMPETGKILGLKITKNRDDRKDLFKSTHAAAKYLRDLYSQLNDWLLVIAAYNGGPARVEYAIKKTRSRNFWDLQYRLPAESRNHVKKFIATHYIMEGQGGVTTTVTADMPAEVTADDIANTEVFVLTGKYNSVVVAKYLAMDIADFNRLNPSFDQLVAVGDYNLRLPSDKSQIFTTMKQQILTESVQILLSGTPTEKSTFPEEIKLPEKKAVLNRSRKTMKG